MFRFSVWHLLLSLIAALVTSCNTGYQAVAVTAVTGGSGPAVALPNAVSQLPVIQLESAGTTVPGLPNAYFWLTSNGTSGSGGQNLAPQPLSFPGTLAAQGGQSINIVTTSSNIPPALVIIELDLQGVPTASVVLQPNTNVTAYPLSNSGRYILQVTAQWSMQNYVTYLFALDVKP